jgi:nitroreductase
MKDFFEIIKSRRSIRKFAAKDVPIELIKKIVDAGRWAPSAMNQQPWEFILMRSAEKKRKVREIYGNVRKERGFYEQDTSFLENGVLVLACAKRNAHGAIFSTALAVENMLLAAEALGLGGIVMTAPIGTDNARKELRELCKIPEEIDLIALLAFGYKAEEPVAKPRRKLEEILHEERF